MSKYKLHLQETEREDLLSMTRKYKTSAQKYIQACVLLSSDDSVPSEKLSARELSTRYGVSEKTIERIRKDFCLNGMQIFKPKPRAVRSDKIYDARVEAHLIALSCQEPSNETAKWTLQLLCDELVRMEVLPFASKTSVCQLLKKTK